MKYIGLIVILNCLTSYAQDHQKIAIDYQYMEAQSEARVKASVEVALPDLDAFAEKALVATDEKIKKTIWVTRLAKIIEKSLSNYQRAWADILQDQIFFQASPFFHQDLLTKFF